MDDLEEQGDSPSCHEMLVDVRDTFDIRCRKVALFVLADLSEEPILVLLLLRVNLKREMSPRSSNRRHVEHADMPEKTVAIMLRRSPPIPIELASVGFC